MNDEKYTELVEKLETFAQQNPARYRLYVGLLAALGYLYILGALVLIVGAIILIGLGIVMGKVVAIGLKLEIGLFILAGIILRSFAVKIPVPEGLELNRSQAPELFAMLDNICRKLKAPPFHHVLLDDAFNAGVIQVPKLGAIGWQVNYLVIGLPLMKALSPDQFRAVIAHEVGHLSGNHSRFGGWIYRLRQTWNTLMQDLHKRRHRGATLFRKFFDWYAPFFAAYSFVLARRNEYEADRCSGEVAGFKTAASTLIAISVQHRYLATSFWPEVLKQADNHPEPVASPYASMFVVQEVLPEDAARWFDGALSEKTDLSDTHPCLTDRLTALGIKPGASDLASVMAEKPIPNAADRYLGGSAPNLASHLDFVWKSSVAPRWKQRYEYASKTKKSLNELEEKAARGEPLTIEEAWNRAAWTAEFQSDEAAIPFYRDVLVMNPDHAAAHLYLGAALLENRDASGLEHVERAMSLDDNAILPGCKSAYAFYLRAGNTEKAETYRKRARERMELLQMARAERSGFTSRDETWPHSLPPEQVARLSAILSRFGKIKAAYLARKAVAFLPDTPYYVIFIEPGYGVLESSRQSTNQQVLAAIRGQLNMPGETWIVVNHKGDARLKKILRSGPGAQIYRRAR